MQDIFSGIVTLRIELGRYLGNRTVGKVAPTLQAT